MVNKKKNNTRVIIVGGGAAGMVAAIAARRKGAEVTLLERNARVGKKLLATGNGRCNLTNINMDISHFHGMNPKFAYSVLKRFDLHQTIELFEYLGVAHKVEEAGKVFPVSDQASSVLDVLRYELEQIGINTVTEAEVNEIKKSNNYFTVVTTNSKKFYGERVIITTGGKASPQLGSNGSGYALAQKLGHHIIEPFAALVQLKLNADFLKQIKGVKFIGNAEIIADNKTVKKEQGEILFTDYGISGPPILNLSRTAGELLKRNEKVWVKVNLFYNMLREVLETKLITRIELQPKKTLSFSFVGLINKRLIPVVLKEAGIEDINKPAGNLTANERRKIINILQDWRFEVTGTNGWTGAQATAGGIDIKEINQKNLESKRVPGLYFAGEVVDIDGDCGGYNLQWAWSSGYVAGESAARKENKI